jgi:peptidoglycan LD-endopeptidase LytH
VVRKGWNSAPFVSPCFSGLLVNILLYVDDTKRMGIIHLKWCGVCIALFAFGAISFFAGRLSSKITYAEELSMASSITTSTLVISDDAIEEFLFWMPEGLQNEVKKLSADPVQDLHVPILFDTEPDDIENSWNYERSDGRIHKGTDIIAPRGGFVVSPTDAVVTNVGYDYRGGNFVLTANPGGEQFYYAHLNEIASGVVPGRVFSRGDLIGYVGNTGNARMTLPHLHFGIYYKGVPVNPYPRLVHEFSFEERVVVLEEIIHGSDSPLSTALYVLDEHDSFFAEVQEAGLALPEIIVWLREHSDFVARARLLNTSMTRGMRNDSVRLLQELLIGEGIGSSAQALGRVGASGYFGGLTERALAEYQEYVSIIPSEGRFGPVTRANILNLLARDAFPPWISVRKSPRPDVVFRPASIDVDLMIGSEGPAVRFLQQHLVATDAGFAARSLAHVGATGYFGAVTRNALAEYRAGLRTVPAYGYFGVITSAAHF